MRVLFFGMNGAFSYPPLAMLLQAQRSGKLNWLEVVGVVLPASAVSHFEFTGAIAPLPPERPQSDLPMLQPYLEPTVIHLAWANELPVYVVKGMRDEAVAALIRELSPDVGCVACFPYVIPSNIRKIPRHGFLNVHPSLLPAYRGPSPMFWVFRDGAQDKSGVTVHWMNEELDSGDILGQRPYALPDGISGPEADRVLAGIGGEMLVEGLAQIQDGTVSRQPQPELGSYQPWPTVEDFTIDANWSARQAFNFMRGTAEWEHPYYLEIGGRGLVLRTAVSFDLERTLDEPVVEVDGRYLIQFSPGVLEAV